MPRRFLSALFAAPDYPPTPEDLRVVRIAGMEMPLRAAVAITVTTFALLFDFTRTFIPEPIQDLYRLPEAIRYQALERTILFGVLPLLVVLLIFRDRPSRYGLRLGDWRWGLSLAVLGCLLATPIIVAIGQAPDFRAYYSVSAAPVDYLLVTNVADLFPAEFIFRGFLMFALVRVIGPLGVLVAALPFVFAHLGKPELELFSTLAGGLVFGWLNWRTGSIVWSAASHVYILTLVLWASTVPI